MSNLFFITPIKHTATTSSCPWGSGADGVLHITSGTTTIAMGTGATAYDRSLNPSNISKSYTSVTIDSGATLEFTGAGWAMIAVCGNFINNGTIRAIDDGTYDTTITGTSPAPDSYALSYTHGDYGAGRGGPGIDCTSLFGYGNYGNGGGGSDADYGGGCGEGQDGQPTHGGNGASYSGALIWGNNVATQNDGGGNGGGSRGKNGAGIYFAVGGNISGTSATAFDVSGSNGGYGGGNIGDGGSGGGAAGGGGGKVVQRYHGSFTASFTSNVSGGTQGGVSTLIGALCTYGPVCGNPGFAGTYVTPIHY